MKTVTCINETCPENGVNENTFVATLIMSCAVSATNRVNCLNCTTTLSRVTGHPEQPLHHENADGRRSSRYCADVCRHLMQ
jgi:hypothetical protein